MESEYKSYFELLDTMQESGRMNMYGAAQMLRELDDDLNKKQATDIAVAWMKQKVVSDE
tara:strand:+ start:283 stop:459 length:177 start_codon:yes stop_codon:yes gene_type:complete